MDSLTASLLDFQIALVAAIYDVTALGILLIGFGFVVGGATPVLGYRIRRLGLQLIGACLIVLIVHAVLIEVYDVEVPLGALIMVYAVAGLLLLQGMLNLLFGPSVGNRVVASLISSLLLSLLALAVRPFTLLRDRFR